MMTKPSTAASLPALELADLASVTGGRCEDFWAKRAADRKAGRDPGPAKGFCANYSDAVGSGYYPQGGAG